VENVKDRLKRVTGALNAAEVPYAIIGGNAMISIGLIDESWLPRYSLELQSRLKELLDDPEG
jgi:hypothetical protein